MHGQADLAEKPRQMPPNIDTGHPGKKACREVAVRIGRAKRTNRFHDLFLCRKMAPVASVYRSCYRLLRWTWLNPNVGAAKPELALARLHSKTLHASNINSSSHGKHMLCPYGCNVCKGKEMRMRRGSKGVSLPDLHPGSFIFAAAFSAADP